MTQVPVQVSWASPADLDRLRPLWRALYAHDVPEANVPSEDVITQHLTRLLGADTAHRLAIAWNTKNQAIGLAAVGLFASISDPRPEHWVQVELKELFVLPQERSAGVGDALLDWVEAWARSVGACRMDWHVKRDNSRGILFYERRGGAVVQTRLSMRKTLGSSA